MQFGTSNGYMARHESVLTNEGIIFVGLFDSMPKKAYNPLVNKMAYLDDGKETSVCLWGADRKAAVKISSTLIIF